MVHATGGPGYGVLLYSDVGVVSLCVSTSTPLLCPAFKVPSLECVCVVCVWCVCVGGCVCDVWLVGDV